MKWYSAKNLPRTLAKPTFSEAWFYSNYGMTFGERYCTDPLFRTEQDREALRLLFDRFARVGIGEKDPPPRPHLEICGHRFISALFGCEVVYQDNQAPTCRHLPVTGAQDLSAIPRPDLRTNRWAQEFRRQGAVLLGRYGLVDTAINHGGPLNVATTMLGNEAFLYLCDSPEIMGAFLDTIADVCVESYDQLTLALDPGAPVGREMFIGNCPVMMIKPQTYRKTVLPADLRLRQRVQKFGLHHCGPMDRYLEAYQSLQPIDYLEVGWGSNIASVRRAFPQTKLDLMINIYDLQSMSMPAMCGLLADMLQQAEPISQVRDIWVADIGPEVSDETVLNFVEAVDRAMCQRTAGGHC